MNHKTQKDSETVFANLGDPTQIVFAQVVKQFENN
jgi:hypothetical protein